MRIPLAQANRSLPTSHRIHFDTNESSLTFLSCAPRNLNQCARRANESSEVAAVCQELDWPRHEFAIGEVKCIQDSPPPCGGILAA